MNRNDARLLVVDDNRSMRIVIKDLLHELGFPQVDEAADGGAALSLFQRTPYDVVITDWQMPHLSGLELLRAIRNGTERRDTPVLLVTGEATTERLMEAVEAGATELLIKPLIAPALSESVLRLVAARPPATQPEPVPALAARAGP